MMAIKTVNALSHYTDWTIGHVHAGALGWVAMISIGTLYHMIPKLWGRERMHSVGLINAHFWLATIGTVLYIASMWVNGKNGDTAGAVLNGGSLSRVAGENVGVYGINQGGLGLVSGNYDLAYQGNNLTITKALLNVIADGKTKVYGDADPSLTYQVSGLKNGDSARTQEDSNLRPLGS